MYNGAEAPEQSSTICWRPWEGVHSHLLQLPEEHFHVRQEPSPINLRCQYCAATFKRESELIRHKSAKHYTKREKCKICLKDFTRKDNLTRHMKLAHSSEYKPFCQHCLKSLSRADAVQRHESTCEKNPNRIDRKAINVPATSSTATATSNDLTHSKFRTKIDKFLQNVSKVAQ